MLNLYFYIFAKNSQTEKMKTFTSVFFYEQISTYLSLLHLVHSQRYWKVIFPAKTNSSKKIKPPVQKLAITFETKNYIKDFCYTYTFIFLPKNSQTEKMKALLPYSSMNRYRHIFSLLHLVHSQHHWKVILPAKTKLSKIIFKKIILSLIFF